MDKKHTAIKISPSFTGDDMAAAREHFSKEIDQIEDAANHVCYQISRLGAELNTFFRENLGEFEVENYWNPKFLPHDQIVFPFQCNGFCPDNRFLDRVLIRNRIDPAPIQSLIRQGILHLDWLTLDSNIAYVNIRPDLNFLKSHKSQLRGLCTDAGCRHPTRCHYEENRGFPCSTGQRDRAEIPTLAEIEQVLRGAETDVE